MRIEPLFRKSVLSLIISFKIKNHHRIICHKIIHNSYITENLETTKKTSHENLETKILPMISKIILTTVVILVCFHLVSFCVYFFQN
jgi:multisubunit Na+/H+ antiporter MnhC subunit